MVAVLENEPRRRFPDVAWLLSHTVNERIWREESSLSLTRALREIATELAASGYVARHGKPFPAGRGRLGDRQTGDAPKVSTSRGSISNRELAMRGFSAPTEGGQEYRSIVD
jgi:hypothetical protein